MRYFLQLSFNGTRYHGWQIQPRMRTVQQTLNETLSKLLRQSIAVTGAGRTDAGVHARGMVAHFDGDLKFEKRDFLYRANAFLPADLAILEVCAVAPQAHARFSALSRTYRYYINLEKNPFESQTAHSLYRLRPDVEEMNQAAELLLKYRDFSSFARSGSDSTPPLCELTRAFWTQRDAQLIFEVTANRFLRNMVRALVGTLLEVGVKKRSVAQFEQLISQRDRSRAGASAPACGLFLEGIRYPEEIYEGR